MVYAGIWNCKTTNQIEIYDNSAEIPHLRWEYPDNQTIAKEIQEH